MSDETDKCEVCTVCGKLAEGGTSSTYLYHDGRRFPVCCPICAQLFQRAPDRFANGERCKTLLDELLDEMKWKDNNR